MSVTPYLYSLSLSFALIRSGIAVSGITWCVQSLLFSSCALHPGLALCHDAVSSRHWSYAAQAKARSRTNEYKRLICFLSRGNSCLKTIRQLWNDGYFKSNGLLDNTTSPTTSLTKSMFLKSLFIDTSLGMISKAMHYLLGDLVEKYSLCWGYRMKYLQNSEYFSAAAHPMVSPNPLSMAHEHGSQILCF